MTAGRMYAARGFTLLELAGAAALCSLLAGILLDRLEAYAGESEHVAAKQLVGTLRTALALRSAQAAASGGQAALLSVAHENPVDWLAKRPGNYLGEYFSPDETQLSKGNWYFDKASRTLVYLPAASKSFSSETPKFLRFKVKLLRVPELIETDGRSRGTQGLVLEQMNSQSVATTN